VSRTSPALSLIPKAASTPTLAQWFPLSHDNVHQISPVSLVKAVNGDGAVTTMEGNKSGGLDPNRRGDQVRRAQATVHVRVDGEWGSTTEAPDDVRRRHHRGGVTGRGRRDRGRLGGPAPDLGVAHRQVRQRRANRPRGRPPADRRPDIRRSEGVGEQVDGSPRRGRAPRPDHGAQVEARGYRRRHRRRAVDRRPPGVPRDLPSARRRVRSRHRRTCSSVCELPASPWRRTRRRRRPRCCSTSRPGPGDRPTHCGWARVRSRTISSVDRAGGIGPVPGRLASRRSACCRAS
jgi:hypothetical protein